MPRTRLSSYDVKRKKSSHLQCLCFSIDSLSKLFKHCCLRLSHCLLIASTMPRIVHYDFNFDSAFNTVPLVCISIGLGIEFCPRILFLGFSLFKYIVVAVYSPISVQIIWVMSVQQYVNKSLMVKAQFVRIIVENIWNNTKMINNCVKGLTLRIPCIVWKSVC